MRFPATAWMIVIFALLAAACGESAVEVTPELTVSPDTVLFSDAQPTGSLFLASGGEPGGQWQLSQLPSWLSATPTSGTLTGAIVEVEMTADMDALDAPVTVASVQVVSDAGAGSVGVKATADFSPRLSVSESTLSVGAGDTETTLGLVSVGRSPIYWSLTTADAWLTVQPTSGSLTFRGQAVEITVTPDRDPLPVGDAEATLSLSTNGTPAGVSIPVVVSVPPDPVLSVSKSQLRYPASTDVAELEIANTGKGDLEWSVAAAPTWLSLDPAQGTLAPDASEQVTATVDRAAVPGGEASGTVTFDSNAAVAEPEVAVLVSDQAGFFPGLTVLDHRVADAEYDLANDRIVTVSNGPPFLHTVDVVLGVIDSVALPVTATSVAVDPTGSLAAVGHDGHVTLVELGTMTVSQTLPVSTDVLDVVLPGNGWVHAFPRIDQWEYIRSVEIATGAETLSTGGSIRAGTIARLHPSGDYAYGADNGLSPSDIEKYDLSAGPAVLMYDSPYHGDFAFNGNLWISEAGDRIFARSGNVFRSSALRAEDMVYAGSLEGTGALRWVVTSTDSGRIYAIREGSENELQVYETEFLAIQGSAVLPSFESPDGPVTALARFVFTHSDGSKVYVLVQADAAAGLARDWGLVVLEGAELP